MTEYQKKHETYLFGWVKKNLTDVFISKEVVEFNIKALSYPDKFLNINSGTLSFSEDKRVLFARKVSREVEALNKFIVRDPEGTLIRIVVNYIYNESTEQGEKLIKEGSFCVLVSRGKPVGYTHASKGFQHKYPLEVIGLTEHNKHAAESSIAKYINIAEYLKPIKAIPYNQMILDSELIVEDNHDFDINVRQLLPNKSVFDYLGKETLKEDLMHFLQGDTDLSTVIKLTKENSQFFITPADGDDGKSFKLYIPFHSGDNKGFHLRVLL